MHTFLQKQFSSVVLRSECVGVSVFLGVPARKALAFSPWVHARIWLSLQMWFITYKKRERKKEEQKIVFKRKKQSNEKVKEQKRNKEIGQIENESGHKKIREE